MVVPSKIFQPPLCVHHCSQGILHPGVGCFRDFLNNLAKHTVGGLKYFSPLLITPLVFHIKTMNNELLLNTLKYYLKTVLWGAMASASSFYWVCLLRNILGRYYKYTTLFLPSVAGLQFCWLFEKKVLQIFCTTTSQAVFESLLSQYPNTFTRVLLHSTAVQTFLFMVNSAIILHYKRLKVYRQFWFMQPYASAAASSQDEPVDQNNDVNDNHLLESSSCDKSSPPKCVHGQVTCSKFLWDGIKSGLSYGIALDLLGALMKGRMPKGCKGIAAIVLGKLKTFRPNMTGFFFLYGGIYRLSSCLLHKYYDHLSTDLQHILAAFLGGSAYLWVDKVSFYTLSTVVAIQALWQQFCKRVESAKANSESKKRTNLVLQLLKDVPFAQIVLSLNVGYLVHNFVLNYEVLNSFTRRFLNALTSNKTKSVRDAITKYSLEELLEFGNTRPVKMFL